ncbi:GntR family transcriptional regulator [Verrucosispora sp. FIM060022]|uniref:GntR family transcriptional regulator n=1 Tax=Verrucosispora sp. FIM060022 TaxID=1479020 RepID=UPI000F86F1A2|nr:GntR family transcriptional regulator [Verrucosispora sp. FIM060022]RUL90965.1 GntR family transcriptional regulator [Verrucosispora sp. FIM060022]
MTDQPRPPEELQRGTAALVIAQAIRNDIQAGRLAHGRQLPGTRSLAQTWNTSVATINRAMALLAEEGLVVNRARSSRIVHNPAGAADRQGPRVILIGGYAGSGKTELGRIIARQTGWAILDKDTTTRAVVEAALEHLGHSPHDRESETYLAVIRPAEYEALMAALDENLQCGSSVVVTAPFIKELSDEAWCDRLSATVAAYNGILRVVWVHCDPITMLTYIRRRGAARDDYKLANWNEYIGRLDAAFTPKIAHIRVDNSAGARPLQEQAKDLLSEMAEQ